MFQRVLFLLFLCLLSLSSGARNYYSDPVTGSMSNVGSFNAPWGSLSSIFSANKTFQAGDTLFLRTGQHGYALIKGNNTGYVTIMPQPGEQPVISRIRVSASSSISASYWKLYQLLVQSEATGNNATPSYYLIEIYPYADHITVSHCTLASSLNTSVWNRDDWRNRCNNGLFTRGRLQAGHRIEYNQIKNVAFGMAVASSNTVVRGNTIEYFTNDGVRILGSHILYEYNRVSDLVKVMTTAENHDDLFQSFTYAAGGAGQDTLKRDTIRNNIFICASDTTRAFRGPAQGIGCFDGEYLEWLVENNLVLTDHWHGISMYGAVRCTIRNNTVMDPYLRTPADPFDPNPSGANIGPTWISINRKNGASPSSENLVINNLVANNVIFADPSMGQGVNNVIMGALTNYSRYFVDVADFSAPALFDLHLKPGSPAIDAGRDAGAAPNDFEGISRPQGLHPDAGAYEFVATTATAAPAPALWIQLAPNPFFSHLNVWCETQSVLRLFDRTGRCVYTGALSSGPQTLALEALPTGVYFWECRAKEAVQRGKVVKGGE